MVEIMKTTSGHHIRSVRAVNPAWQRTADGNHVRPIRLIEPPLWPAGLLHTPSGFPMEAVRFVDAAGLYTTNRAVSATPEDVFTPDGNPIEAVAIFSSVPAPEVVFTLDGRFIEAVWAVDATGLAITADADAAAWADAVVTNGGTVSAARQVIVNDFVVAEKTAGTWALTDDYWALWAENAVQARTSLKQRRLATLVAAPTFTTDRGYAWNGTTQYLNTGFVPSTHAIAMTGSNLRLAVYERSDVGSSTACSIGCSVSSVLIALMYARGTSSFVARLNCSTSVPFVLPVSTSVGFTSTARDADLIANCVAYKNGVSMTRSAAAPTFGSVLPAFAFYIGAANASGTASQFRGVSTGFACYGATLTPAQELAQYDNVQAWATSVGAQV